MSKKDPRKLILEVLRKHPEGLTIISIAKLSGLHRHTSTKYIHELIGAEMIFQRNIGAAKLCYLDNKVSKKREQNKILRKLEERRSGKKYGLKLMLTVVLLSFLLSETVILAYQNITIINDTNLSGFSTINTSPMTETSASNNSPQISEIINNTFENSSSQGNETSSIQQPFNTSDVPENNETTNNTEDFNQTLLNETLEDNQTVENITIVEPIPEPIIIIDDPQPEFSIKLDYPQKITRGQTLNLKATAENMGFSVAKNSKLEWVLPEGFLIISGEHIKSCGDIQVSSACIAEIIVKTDFSTLLGLGEIKILVHHEK